MTIAEWNQFLVDLRVAMLTRYTETQADIIVEWFRNIRGSHEQELIGDERFMGMMKFIEYHDGWNLYNATMARAWIYAPFILKKAGAI